MVLKMAYDPFDFFEIMRKMFKEFDREFESMFREFEKVPEKPSTRDFGRLPMAGFKIEIRDDGLGRPEVKVTRFGRGAGGIHPIVEKTPAAPKVKPYVETKKREEKTEEKPIKQMLETNAGKIEKVNEVILTMQAPDVSKEDVDIRRVGNSVEVIARRKSGEAFFAAYEVPPDIVVENCGVEVKNNMVIISIPRRRRHQK
jgi:HSP20 family molecular chaperone IbpA